MAKRQAIWLPGQPARVTHQSGTRIGIHGTYKTPALKKWENELSEKLAVYAPDQPTDKPILLQVTFGYKAKTKKDLYKWKLTKPDTDNAIKSVKDVMTKLGFWNDDAQVVFETCKKVWVDQPGIVIVLEELGGRCEDWKLEEWRDEK